VAYPDRLRGDQAILIRRRALPGVGPPCARVGNDDGIWVSVGSTSAPGALSYCAKHGSG
jgi:hypothetical protein